MKKILSLNGTKAGDIPRVVAVIYGRQAITLAKEAKSRGADILEIRIDQLPSINKEKVVQTVKEIRAATNLPIISTIRSKTERGTFDNMKFRFSHLDRFELFKAVMPFTDFIDIELSAGRILRRVIDLAHKDGKAVIVSYHNFKETPSNSVLSRIVDKAKRGKADIIKIAAFAKEEDDVGRLMAFTLTVKDLQVVTISLGGKGSISRIIAPIFGSCLTYGYVHQSLASGQLQMEFLIEELRRYCPKYKDCRK